MEDGFFDSWGDETWMPDGDITSGGALEFNSPDLGTVDNLVGSVYQDGDTWYATAGSTAVDYSGVYLPGGDSLESMGGTPDQYELSYATGNGSTLYTDTYETDYATGGGSQTTMGTPINYATGGGTAGGNFASTATQGASLFNQLASLINSGSTAVTGRPLITTPGVGGNPTAAQQVQLAQAKKQQMMLIIGALAVGGFLLLRRR